MSLLDNTTIARPYAQAAFEYALTNNETAAWAEFLGRMAQYSQDVAVVEVLKSPKYTEKQAEDVMLALAGDGVSTEQVNLLKLLAEKNRLSALPAVKHLFDELKEASEAMMQADVFSVVPLDDEYKAELSQALSKKFGAEVALNCQIDESLVGGIMIRIDDTVIDKSITNQFERLKATLARA